MKHRKLLIGTSIGCAVLLAGGALYLGCAASLSKSREGPRVSALSGADKENLRGNTDPSMSASDAPGRYAGDYDEAQVMADKAGNVNLTYGETSAGSGSTGDDVLTPATREVVARIRALYPDLDDQQMKNVIASLDLPVVPAAGACRVARQRTVA